MPGGNRPHKWPQVSLPVAVAVYGSGQRPTKLLDRELARSIAIAHLFRRGRGTGGADFARGSCSDELPCGRLNAEANVQACARSYRCGSSRVSRTGWPSCDNSFTQPH